MPTSPKPLAQPPYATLSAVSGQDVTIDIGYAGTATLTSDIHAQWYSNRLFPAGSTTGTVTVTAVPRYGSTKPMRRIIVSISNVHQRHRGDYFIGYTNYHDDDVAPSVSWRLTMPTSPKPLAQPPLPPHSRPLQAKMSQIDLGYAGTATLTSDTRAVVLNRYSAGSTTGTVTVTAVQDYARRSQ